jgi:scaffold protein (connect acetoacetyl-CoA thiolase and HMG-CoA synthase)
MLSARCCAECGKMSVNAATCRFCGAEGGEVVNLSGRGRLLSWTVIRVAPARYASEAPYAVGLLELAEGPRITARLEGDPERLVAGQSLGLVTVDPTRGPVFR